MSELQSQAAARRGRTLKLYLVDGSPSGVITAELGVSSVRAAVATRTALPELVRREEASRTGIYLVMRWLSKRWGSYTPKGRIILNIDLIRASPNLIDYVICHELAHAFHPDHGPEWRDLLFTVMPDWEARKALLENMLR